jgi:hypothetical protein
MVTERGYCWNSGWGTLGVTQMSGDPAFARLISFVRKQKNQLPLTLSSVDRKRRASAFCLNEASERFINLASFDTGVFTFGCACSI